MPSLEENRQRAQSHFEKSEQRKIEAAKSRYDYQAQFNADVAKAARLRAIRLAKEAADELVKKALAAEKLEARAASAKTMRKKPARRTRLPTEP